MPRVIYLTGAPATGKSTLSRELQRRIPNLKVFSYSEELREHVALRIQQEKLSEEDIRQKSAEIITRSDVEAIDKKLIAYVEANRTNIDIVIDSHPVTKESYGFRVTPFTKRMLEALSPDVILCLYGESRVIAQRIQENPIGRPMLSQFEFDYHQNLQSAVAVQYGLLLDKPVYFLSSAVGPQSLADNAISRAGITQT